MNTEDSERRYAQIEGERDYYKRLADSRAKERDAALEREQALAAQFIAMQDAATDLIHASTEEGAGDAMERIAECSEKQARDLLAHRDLLQQAEALETFAGSMPMLSSMGAKEALRLRADELRKQAEGQE